jgi:hypothetical protein
VKFLLLLTYTREESPMCVSSNTYVQSWEVLLILPMTNESECLVEAS